MSGGSAIEWTDDTWNPLGGCSVVSKGCQNCYAMRNVHRWPQWYGGLTKSSAKGRVWTGDVRLFPQRLDTPLRWTRPRRIFVNSLSDLFHEDVPEDFIDRVFGVMAMAPNHTFQVLTKRPERMLEYASTCGRNQMVWEQADQQACDLNLSERHPGGDYLCKGKAAATWPLPNVWLGVSAENQETADPRIRLLLMTPAAVRSLSAEPLLGRIQIQEYLPKKLRTGLPRLGWVVVGGESGPKARPMHPQWARDIRDQCAASGVPFHFKQWGEWRPPYVGQEFDTLKGHAGRPPAFLIDLAGNVHCTHDAAGEGAHPVVRVGKKKAGRVLDGGIWDEYPACEGRAHTTLESA